VDVRAAVVQLHGDAGDAMAKSIVHELVDCHLRRSLVGQALGSSRYFVDDMNEPNSSLYCIFGAH
jgi:hypothetical protein